MAIEKTKVIDAIGIDKITGEAKISIIDSLNWDDEKKHVLLLQEKINSYLRFVESGEVYIKFPEAKERKIIFDIIGKYPLSKLGEQFFSHAKNTIINAGFDLTFNVHETEKGNEVNKS